MKRIKRRKLKWILGCSFLLGIILAALFAPLLTSFIPGKVDITQRLLPPSPEHWLGTDLKGIDIWTSLLYGARISLMVSFFTVLITTTVGGCLGLLAGYLGGWFEQILMRLIDVLMAFPGMILTLSFAAVLVPSYFSLIFSIALTGWMETARIIRAEVLSLKEREYILAARALGAPTGSLLFKHILPALLPLLLTQVTASVASVIRIESGLSFLGLGPHGLVPTWGQLLSEGRTVILESPLLSIAPGLSIFLLLLSVHLIGDSLNNGSRGP